MSKKIWALRHLIYSFDIKILETVCRSKIIGLRYSACGVHLNVVDPGGDGEVNAEDDDEHQQADEEEQPVLPPKLYTCRHKTVTSRPRLATTQTQAKQNKICWIHLEQTAQKSFLNFCCIGYFGRYETNQAFMPGFGML